jgi:hypothetical protein
VITSTLKVTPYDSGITLIEKKIVITTIKGLFSLVLTLGYLANKFRKLLNLVISGIIG